MTLKSRTFSRLSFSALLCIQQLCCSAQPMSASDSIVIPAGWKIAICLEEPVDNKNITADQQIRAHTTEDVLVDGKVCIPANTKITGSIGTRSGCRWGAYTVVFNQLTRSNNNQTISIFAVPVVRGGVLRVKREGEEITLRADVGAIHTMSKVAAILGTRLCSPDLKAGDEISLQTREDIRI
jgi:hypothetical protein